MVETTIRAGIAILKITLGQRDAIILFRLVNNKPKNQKIKKRLYLKLNSLSSRREFKKNYLRVLKF